MEDPRCQSLRASRTIDLRARGPGHDGPHRGEAGVGVEASAEARKDRPRPWSWWPQGRQRSRRRRQATTTAKLLWSRRHRPGVENRRADLLSRWKQDSTDLKLDPKYFRLAEQRWGRHTVDLFATRLNRQVGRFVSWRPDPEATAVDAFQFPLIGENPWCFPPEALIPRLLGQITRQRATVTLVAPQWPGSGPTSSA